MIRIAFLGLAVIFAAGLLFVNIYNSVVDAPNWGAAIPDSISAARHYFTVSHPGHFFRIASPLNQLLAIISVIACWKFGRVKYIALSAFAMAVLGDLFTFGYFYPRNEIIFKLPVESNVEAIRLAVEQWSSMNWVRSAIVAIDTVLAFLTLVITTKKSAL